MRNKRCALVGLLGLLPVYAAAATPGVIQPGQVMTADWFNGVRSAALGALQASTATNSLGQIILPSVGDVSGATTTWAGSSSSGQPPAISNGTFLNPTMRGGSAVGLDLSKAIVAIVTTGGSPTTLADYLITLVPFASIGQPSGVAGLDATGGMNAPVTGDVSGASATLADGTKITLGAYLGSLATLDELYSDRVGVYPDNFYVAGDADDTPSFSRAISGLCTYGGGILNIKARHYQVSSAVVVPCPIQIRGTGWQSGFAASGSYDYSAAAGSWIDVKTDSSTSPISISGTAANGASVEDVAFFYAVPGTTTAGVFTPTTQAPTIAVANVGGDVSIRNVFMPGTYSGVMADNGGRVNIDGLFGQFFNYAYQTDNDYDITRVNNVQSWVYWSQDAAVIAWQQLHTNVLRLGRVDIPFIDHIFAFAAWSGIQTFQGANGPANGVSVGTLGCDSTTHCLDIGAAGNTISIANLREFGQAGISSGVPYSNATAIAFESAGYGAIQVGNLEARMIDAAPIWSGATSGCSSVRVANLLEDFSASQESVAHTSVEPTTCAAGGNLSVYLGNTPNVILKASGQTMVHGGDNAKTYFAAQVQQ
mgnify:FL=1